MEQAGRRQPSPPGTNLMDGQAVRGRISVAHAASGSARLEGSRQGAVCLCVWGEFSKPTVPDPLAAQKLGHSPQLYPSFPLLFVTHPPTVLVPELVQLPPS